MKYLLLVSLLVFSEVNGQDFAPATLIISEPVQAGETIDKFCLAEANANKKYCNGAATNKTCLADGFHQCDATGKSGFSFPCLGDFGVYCNEPTPGAAKCQTTPAEGCDRKASGFDCTGNGVFPDPNNCRIFYNCFMNSTTKTYTIQTFECGSAYVFDPSYPNSYYCRKADQKYCTTVACNGANKNMLLTYTWFPKTKGQFVALCRGDLTPLIYRCDEGFVPDLTTAPVECNYVCKGTERAVYAADDTKYYQCVNVGGKNVPQLMECFIPKHFNPVTKVCA